MATIFEYIDLKHKQKAKKDAIVEGILDAIEGNAISKGAPLPSVNKMIQTLGVARMTVVKALNELKERGVIVSEDKVGYFVNDINVTRKMKVLLFLTSFASYHENLYNHIIEDINDSNITIDLYFHHCNPQIVKSVLNENLGNYGMYIISVFESPLLKTILSRIPSRKLLQIIRPPLFENVSSIHQDFTLGLKTSLNNIKSNMLKYDRFILIFSEKYGHPQAIRTSFIEFCAINNINSQIENKISSELLVKGTAFWVIEDNDLIALIKMGEDIGLQIGNEIGILSYNDTPVKEYIRNGITSVSVDFAKMGQSISKYIKNPVYTHEVFVPELIIRNSF
jgi:DNA-binding transcriptional regulator YhcF (GntR family)